MQLIFLSEFSLRGNIKKKAVHTLLLFIQLFGLISILQPSVVGVWFQASESENFCVRAFQLLLISDNLQKQVLVRVNIKKYLLKKRFLERCLSLFHHKALCKYQHRETRGRGRGQNICWECITKALGMGSSGGCQGAACAKQDTLAKVQWKMIMRHQVAAFISTSSTCITVLLMLLCLPDSAQIPVRNLSRLLGCQ